MGVLSDKVARIFTTLPNDSGATGVLADDELSVRNLEACISMMSRLVIPLCARIQEHYHTVTVPNLPYPVCDWCNKVPVLCRQLQELMAWCGDNRNRVPSSIPFTSSTTSSSSTTISSYSSDLASAEQRVELFARQHPDLFAESLLVIDDALLCCIKELTAKSSLIPMDLVFHVQYQLYQLVQAHISTDISMSLCGSTALGLPSTDFKCVVDYSLTIGPYQQNIYDYTPAKQRESAKRYNATMHEKRQLEMTTEDDRCLDELMRQLNSLIADIQQQAREYINKLTFDVVAIAVAASQSSTMTGGIVGSGNNNSNNHRFQQSLLLDLDAFYKIGIEVIHARNDYRMQRIRELPLLPLALTRLGAINEQLEVDEMLRITHVKKHMKALSKCLKEVGLKQVSIISNRARFLHINYVHEEKSHLQLQLPVNVIVSNPTALHTTKLIDAYMGIDKSGKVHSFLHALKLIVCSQGMADPANGYLSVTAWYIMALHVLLRLEYVPNIHMHCMFLCSKQQQQPKEGRSVTLFDLSSDVDYKSSSCGCFPVQYTQKLQSVSVIALLDSFFRYFLEQLDLFSSVVTLRDKGVTLSKREWTKGAVLWRMSIEVLNAFLLAC